MAPVAANQKAKKRQRRRKKAGQAANDFSDEDLGGLGRLTVVRQLQQRRRQQQQQQQRRRQAGGKAKGRAEEDSMVKYDARLLLCPYIQQSACGSFEFNNPSAKSSLGFDALSSAAAAVRPRVDFPQAERMSRAGSWSCVFCSRDQSDAYYLGPLFGPYFANAEQVPMAELVADSRIEETGELWTHLHCAIWAPAVAFDGSRVSGLAESVASGWRRICVECGKAGALLPCSNRKCGRIFHHPCAIEAGAELDDTHYLVTCAQHRKYKS